MSNELHETDMPPTPVADNAANSDIEPAPMSEGLVREALVEVLAEHRYKGLGTSPGIAVLCSCGETSYRCGMDYPHTSDQWRAHLADAIARDWLPGVIRAAEARALREAADECDRDAQDGHCRSVTCAENNRITAAWLRDRADWIE